MDSVDLVVVTNKENRASVQPFAIDSWCYEP